MIQRKKRRSASTVNSSTTTTISQDLNEQAQEMLAQLSGKWKILILWRLSKKTSWFNQLKRELPHISASSLAAQLSQLEAAGFIERKIYQEPLLVVEYSLTNLGKSLAPVFRALSKWAQDLIE